MRSKRLQKKDMGVLREGDSAIQQHKMSRGVVKDYSLKHKVVIEWDLSEDAERDEIFRMSIGGNTAILDVEEVMRLLRWI